MLSSDKDIGRLLRDWKYDPNKVNVRRLIGEDGREKIQLRVDLGILQMEVEGRPDGKRPYGKESLLEHFQSRRRDKQVSGDKDFSLSHDDCLKLQQEAVQYYHRYLSLFHLGDFEGVIRDTFRNLKVFDLVKEHAENLQDSLSLEQYHPFVLMMHVRAKASIALREKDYDLAINFIDNGINEIEDLVVGESDSERPYSGPEIQFLRRWVDEINDLRPVDSVTRLEKKMQDAVRKENFELAAKIRDEIIDKKRN